MQDFCAQPTRKKYELLDKEARELLYQYSVQIMRSEQEGDYRLANRILSYHDGTPLRMAVEVPHFWRRPHAKKGGWVCDEIAVGTELYRAGKSSIPLQKNRPTYFALEIGNANQYLPVKKEGYLTVYRAAKALCLFRLDSVDNINRLLRHLHGLKNDTLYRVVLKMFYPPLLKHYKTLYDTTILHETHPIQFKRLVRYSLISNDFLFANWLCQQGFEGYSAGVMHIYSGVGKTAAEFPEEVLLCDPSRLTAVATFHTQKKKNREALDSLLDSQKK